MNWPVIVEIRVVELIKCVMNGSTWVESARVAFSEEISRIIGKIVVFRESNWVESGVRHG